MRAYVILTFAIVALIGCKQEYLPKPKGYNRIDLPPHSYRLSPDTLPYQFRYSTIAELEKDQSWISERYWINLRYPTLGADIQITYKPIKNLDSLMLGYFGDSYKLTSQHQIKAYSIEESIVELPNGDYASVSELQGEVPTQIQFHVSDSSRHFLRGALYFKTATKNDSLAPVINFLRTDIHYLLQSLEWN